MALTKVDQSMIDDTGGALYPLVLGTSQVTTSGTAKDFTGIPSWVKRVTVALRGVSTAGVTDILVQIGSGSILTTGYNATSSYIAAGVGTTNSVAGFNILYGNASQVASGLMTLVHMGGNNWIATYMGKLGTTLTNLGGGDVALSGVLDRLRLTTANGTDTFDAGSVNILYE